MSDWTFTLPPGVRGVGDNAGSWEAFVPGRFPSGWPPERSPEEMAALKAEADARRAAEEAELARQVARHEELVGVVSHPLVGVLLSEHQPHLVTLADGREIAECRGCREDSDLEGSYDYTWWPCPVWETIDREVS